MTPQRAWCTRLLLLAMLASPTLVWAEPMRLEDPSSRWVAVKFEVSPADQPAQLDTVYTRRLRGWLEPAGAPGQIQVSIDGSRVEQVLLAGEKAVPGTFGSFVWVFDVGSGDVVSAQLVGTLVKILDWGLFQTRVEAPIRVAMDTRTRAGFRPLKRYLGQSLFRYCQRPGRDGCTGVEPVRYDRVRGYVNAVGPLAVDFQGVTLHTFSPLGEAMFAEIPADDGAESEAQIARQQ